MKETIQLPFMEPPIYSISSNMTCVMYVLFLMVRQAPC